MSRSVRLVVLGALVLLAASVVARFGASDSNADFMGNLNASVGGSPASIALRLPDGTLVTSLGPGTYAIHVSDTAANHNFHLMGPGVDMATGIEESVEADWTVDFGTSGYSYLCDRHPSTLLGSFMSGVAAAPPAAPAPAPVIVTPAPVVVTPAPVIVSTLPTSTRASASRTIVSGTVKVTLGPKGAFAVTKNGKPVAKLPAGLYDVVVVDRSARHDVSVRKIGGLPLPLTTRSFTGTRTTQLELAKGQWKLYSIAAEQQYFSFVRVTA